MKSILIVFTFLHFQNIFSSMKEEKEIVDHFDTSQGKSECSDVETDSTVDVETPVPSGSKDSTTCGRCLELQDLTLSMEKLSFEMNLEKRRQEDRIKEILDSIRESFKGKKGVQMEREQEGKVPFGESLLMVLETIGDIIAGMSKANLCKREDLGSEVCFRHFYQSSLFIHKYLSVGCEMLC
jgi:hypothetical protein